jgi:hypothetical protein
MQWRTILGLQAGRSGLCGRERLDNRRGRVQRSRRRRGLLPGAPGDVLGPRLRRPIRKTQFDSKESLMASAQSERTEVGSLRCGDGRSYLPSCPSMMARPTTRQPAMTSTKPPPELEVR